MPKAADAMTPRDYFAAMTLTGLTRISVDADDRAEIAALCYQMADAMLAERAKITPPAAPPPPARDERETP